MINELKHWENNKNTYTSLTLSFNLASPKYSQSSWNSILINILLDEEVSSSFNLIIDKTCKKIEIWNQFQILAFQQISLRGYTYHLYTYYICIYITINCETVYINKTWKKWIIKENIQVKLLASSRHQL